MTGTRHGTAALRDLRRLPVGLGGMRPRHPPPQRRADGAGGRRAAAPHLACDVEVPAAAGGRGRLPRDRGPPGTSPLGGRTRSGGGDADRHSDAGPLGPTRRTAAWCTRPAPFSSSLVIVPIANVMVGADTCSASWPGPAAGLSSGEAAARPPDDRQDPWGRAWPGRTRHQGGLNEHVTAGGRAARGPRCRCWW